VKRVRRSAAIAVVLGSLVLSACRSSSSTSTTSISSPSGTSAASAAGQTAAAYVAGFCKAFTDYLKQATPALGTGSDIQKLKGFYVSLFDGEISATHDLVTKIKALGTPAVPGGAQVSHALIQAFTATEPDSRSLRDEAASLPTSSPSAFNRAVKRLFLRFRQDSKGITLSANPFHSNPQLLAAFRSSPECAVNATPRPSSGSPALSSAASIPSSTNG
jgi:hypothetical protein